MNSQKERKRRVLLAEDDPATCQILKNYLDKWDYDVTVVRDGLAALKVLEEEDAPRLAVLDWMMPGLEGVEICQRIRERKGRPYVYVILLTVRSDKRDLLQGLKGGADNYLAKPIDPEALRAHILVGERILNLQDDLIAAREEVRFRATHDGLTGICNRVTIIDALGKEISRQGRGRHAFGVILIDIDHFKNVNDTHGHACGDEVLQSVAQRVKGCLRPYDTVGRYGGEEFLVIAPNADGPGTLSLAERIRGVVGSQATLTKGGEVRVTASLGAAVSTGGPGSDPQILLRLADEALYRAKEKGRNRSELASEPALTGPSERSSRRSNWV
jgi:two-component system, cell cycle response regulator